MRYTIAAAAAVLLSVASFTNAQDSNCTAVLNDYAPTSSGAYQKCFTNQVYNTALVNAGPTPDFKALIEGVCSKSACSASTLDTAETKYLAACNASLAVESQNGNILQLGKSALDVFFATPIRAAYCALDPNAVPLPAPQVTPPQYCLSSNTTNPAGRFVSQLAIYLTAGTIRSNQAPFFNTSHIDPTELCSACSQVAMSSTVDYLSKTKMPAITPFYTPEFVQYWTKLVVAYNDACKTTLVQTWPAGTLNVTVPNAPTSTATVPDTSLPTSTGATPTGTTAPNAAGSLKPVAGVATVLLMVVAALL
ncbi:hypothetical protein EC957_002776 [Mortierella hygrophila]|uniref:Uncharacterized protein n=1 Tax=Mortierella hygrophila TaxID=979708 RepID=A0A9P6K7L1_9FUNG|nr:hypothetical protein EC957_002776 [Mortierella hygrophila]